MPRELSWQEKPMLVMLSSGGVAAFERARSTVNGPAFWVNRPSQRVMVGKFPSATVNCIFWKPATTGWIVALVQA